MALISLVFWVIIVFFAFSLSPLLGIAVLGLILIDGTAHYR